MQRHAAERDADQKNLRVRRHTGGGFAANARMHDGDRAAENDRKQRQHAKSEGADSRTRRRHRGDNHGDSERAHWDVEAVTDEPYRSAAGAVTPAERYGDREDRGADGERAEWRPIECAKSVDQCKPNERRRTEADDQPVPLGEYRINQREDAHRASYGTRADGAGRDEIRRLLQRQNDVRRADRGWQRADQRADERPAPLDCDRNGDHGARRQRHLQNKTDPEKKLGREHWNYRTRPSSLPVRGKDAASHPIEFYVHRRAVLNGLVDHAIAFGELEKLVELVLRRVSVEIEVQTDLSEADRRVLGDAERAAKIEVAFRMQTRHGHSATGFDLAGDIGVVECAFGLQGYDGGFRRGFVAILDRRLKRTQPGRVHNMPPSCCWQRRAFPGDAIPE